MKLIVRTEKMGIGWCWLVATLFIISCGGGGGETPPAHDSPPKLVACFGTSLTTGSEPVPAEGPNGIAHLMENHDEEMNTLTWNFGVGGHSSRDLLDHLVLFDFYEVVPKIVTIETAMNDSYRGIPYDEVKANLKIIIDFFKERDSKIYLMTTNPSLLGEEIHPNLEVYYALYHDIAAENEVELIDFFVMWLTYTPEELAAMIPDGCHPSMVALELVVWPTMKDILLR